MKNKSIGNRLLSLVLCFCMALSLFSGISPMRANAAGTDGMITIELTDSYGDGWNGNAIEIYANEALLDTATINSGNTGTWSIAQDSHLTYTFKWVSGDYADETSFVIYLGTEEKLNARGDSYSTGDTLLTVEPLCSEPEFENGICLYCGKSCTHSFTDSVCTICGFACGTDKPHGWNKGICSVCGTECGHDNWTDCICGICGYSCGSDGLHSFADCVCTVCGFTCGTHEPHNWQNGVCTVCSLNCAHASVTEGVCATCSGTCGVSFAHRFNTDDLCTVCGFVCFHTWESGRCTVCGRNCAHESYENGFCTICEDYQAAVDADGDGYYDIANGGNLYWFAREVNGDNRTIYGELTADIVVNEGVLNADGTLKGDGSTLRVWTPIGTKKALSFKGKFNGNDHSISGLYYSGDSEYMGLFGCVRDGRIENVGVVDSYFSVTGSLSEIGAIAGYLYNASNSEIINCYNTGTVFGKYTTGGVVGLGQGGIVTGCYNTGWVSGHGQTGGVISNAENTMLSNCYNTGRVESSSMSHAGGVVGRYSNKDKSVVLSHCYNTGDVVNTNSYGGAGGIVGNCTNHIENCYSTGSVTAGRNAGGVAALLNVDGLTMTNCYYSSDAFTGGASGDPEDTLINCAGLPMEKFLSGEVCWLLNGSSSEGVWKQTLVDDTLPGFSGETVYQVRGTYCTGEEGTVYSNTNASVAAVHKDENNDHLCDGCGETASQCRDWNKDHLCDVCSQVFSQHSGGTATCSAKAICTVCGQEYGETDPANHDSGVAFDSNGFCPKGCYAPGVDTDGDGYYEIGNAGQLYWFAQLVNLKGEVTAKAVLTADIDLGGRTWYPIGLYKDPAVPEGETLVVQYNGVIDGKGHTVSNFKAIGYGSQGLVGYSARNAIVRNLGVINAEVSGWNAGAVMAYMGTVENCYAIDCSITGSTDGSTTVYVGAISGTQQSVVRNSFAYNCTLTEGANNQAIIGAVGGNSVSNSYYGSIEVSNGTLRSKEGETEMSQEQFASGEVAYLLGEGWGQSIGEQATPILGGETVYYTYSSCDETVMDMGYRNSTGRPDHTPGEDDGDCTTAIRCAICDAMVTEGNATHTPGEDDGDCTTDIKCAFCDVVTEEGKAAHDYQNGFCEVCEVYEEASCNADGYYEIDNGGKLFRFAQKVNSGENANLILMNDIDLESREWTPMGSEEQPYTGVIDGNGYAIRNLYISESARDVGFIGKLSGGGVKNLTLSGTVSVETAVNGGILVGFMVDSALYNCYTSGSISITNAETYSTPGDTLGGIVGLSQHGIVLNCGTDATVSYASTNESGGVYVGGVVGYLTAGYAAPICILNSYSHSQITVTLSDFSGNPDYIGGIAGLLLDDAVNNYFCGSISVSQGEDILVGYAFGDAESNVTINETTYELLVRRNYAPAGTNSLGGGDADIATFTEEELAATTGEAALVSLLNEGLEDVAQVIDAHSGILTESEWAALFEKFGGEACVARHWKVEDGKPVHCPEQMETCSCDACGLTDHTWSEATCTAPKTCTVCGETDGDPIPHSTTADGDKPATCTSPAFCSVCGESYGEPDADNHASTDFTYTYKLTQNFAEHEKFHACCGVSLGLEKHSYNGQTGCCNECGAEILIAVDVGSETPEYLTHVEYALRRGGFTATLLKNYTNTGSYKVAVKELLFAEGVTLTNNGTLELLSFTYATIPTGITGGTVIVGGSSYTWNGEKYVCAQGTHTEETIPGKAATCIESGLSDGVICSVCGTILTKQEEIPATGEHIFENGSCIYGCGTTNQCTVTFAGYGTEYLQSMTVESGSVITLPCRWADLFNMDGYVFAGYNTEEDGSGKTYMDCTAYSVTESVTLYAQWAEIAVGDVLLNSGEYVDTEGNITSTMPEGGYAYFNNGTLTLHDYNYEGEGYLFIHYPSSDDTVTSAVYYEMGDLKVLVEGENTLHNPTDGGYGLRGRKNVNISGTGSIDLNANSTALCAGIDLILDGESLELSATTPEYHTVYAIGDITLNGGSISIYSGNFGIYAEGGNSHGNITVNGGSLTIDSEQNGLECLGAFIVTGGTVTISADLSAVYTYGGITIENVKLLVPENGRVLQDGSAFFIVDSEGNTATNVVIGEEHTHIEEIIPGKEPTCGETGLTEGVKCAVCGAILTKQEEIPALDHSYGEDGLCIHCGERGVYDIWIQDIRVTSTNAADILGDLDEGATVTYDAASNTLYLNNATITGTEIGIKTLGDLNLHITGNNLITPIAGGDQSIGIDVLTGLLTIDGTGSLTVQSGAATSSYGILSGDLHVKGGTVTVAAGEGTISMGIKSSGKTTVTVDEGACLTATGNPHGSFFGFGIMAQTIVNHGTLNTVAILTPNMDMNDFTEYLLVYGTASLEENCPAMGFYHITQGAVLTIAEGVTMDMSHVTADKIIAEGNITSNGTVILPDSYSYSTIPTAITGGTLTIGESSYIWNGEKYICVTHVDADNSGYCDTCNCQVETARLYSCSISLKGNIAINYYMILSDGVAADENAYMQFTMADGEIIKLPVSRSVKTVLGDQTYYVFTCEVDAKEMTDQVISQFFYRGGSTQAYAYSVQTYAQNMLNKNPCEELETLIKAMLHYGAASQIHFEYNTDKLANAGLEVPDYSNMTIQGFTSPESQGTDLAKLYATSLLLKSETTLRFFFQLDSSVETFSATYDGQSLEVLERGGLFYVDVVGIAAKDLDEYVTITISDGVNTADVTFNPMSYCRSVYNNSTGAFDRELKDLVAALYLYNQAANEYLKER